MPRRGLSSKSSQWGGGLLTVVSFRQGPFPFQIPTSDPGATGDTCAVASVPTVMGTTLSLAPGGQAHPGSQSAEHIF